MAGDFATLMGKLGYDSFHAVGHDRGGYVVQRLALDHPELVDRLVILGDVPIGEALQRCDARFATAWWHWFFIGQPELFAERLIRADPDAWYHLDPAVMGDENHADAANFLYQSTVQHTMCEDYRAGLGVDRAADDEDQADGRRIVSPLLVAWGTQDNLAELYDHDILGIWRRWAADVTGSAINAGHHLMEEAPAELAAMLVDFLAPSEKPSAS